MAKRKDDENPFVASAPPWVIIPYSEYEKVVNMANNYEEMQRQLRRMEEMYQAMYGMWSECLDKIGEIRDYVGNS